MSFKHFFVFIFYLLFFLSLVKNSLGYLDNDFGWHLKSGEEVATQQTINKINHFNYVFGDNDTWVNHEWLSDFFVFLIYNHLGYFSLTVLFALLIIITIGITHRFIIKNFTQGEKSSPIILLLLLLGIIASSPHFGIRIQEVSFLFLTIELITFYNFEKASSQKRKASWKKLIPLPIIIALWANMHGSFLLGVSLLYFYLLIKMGESVLFSWGKKHVFLKKISQFFNFQQRLNTRDLKVFFLFAIFSTLSTLATPYGISLYSFLSSYTNTAYLKIISEWLPIYHAPIFGWQVFYISLTVSAVLVSFVLYKNKLKINSLWSFSLITLFVLMSIKSRRHFPLLFISSLPFVSAFFYQEIFDFLKNIALKKRFGDFLLKVYLSLIVLAVSGSMAISIKIIKNPFLSYCHKFPCQALNVIKNDKEMSEAKMFNSYDWGGYLIHQWPHKKIFIDGRLPQKTINGHSFIEEYLLFQEKDLVAQKTEEYGIELFLLQKHQPSKKRWLDKILEKEREGADDEKDYLLEFLEENYIKKYEDDVALVYFKK